MNAALAAAVFQRILQASDADKRALLDALCGYELARLAAEGKLFAEGRRQAEANAEIFEGLIASLEKPRPPA